MSSRSTIVRSTCLNYRALALCIFAFATAPYLQAHAQATGNPQTSTLPASSAPAFHGYDVISVKPNKSSSGNMSFGGHETTFRAENVSLKMLLSNAFGIRESLISGLPSWALSSRWDINAKVLDPDPALMDRKLTEEQSVAEWRAETLSILVDRFHLKTHTETATSSIFDLVVAKGGSKLKPADPSEKSKAGMGIHNTLLTATSLPVSALVQFLGNETGRNVVDKTGLSGDYDMTLKWSREEQSGADNGSADNPPILFTALEEQLGLKLVPAKGPVTTLVVDSIETPAVD